MRHVERGETTEVTEGIGEGPEAVVREIQLLQLLT